MSLIFSWGIRPVPKREDKESFKKMTSGMEGEVELYKPVLRKISCGACPRACSLQITIDDKGKILDITGNRCRRGLSYAKGLQEGSEGLLHSSVRVRGGVADKCPVVTTRPLDKNLHMRAQVALRRMIVSAPVAKGDQVLEDLLGTGIPVVATETIEEHKK